MLGEDPSRQRQLLHLVRAVVDAGGPLVPVPEGERRVVGQLDAEVLIYDEIVLETPGGPNGDLTSLAFEIKQRNKDKWNYLIGFNWEMNRRFSVMVEAGFGGSRENVIAGAAYRF